MSDRARPVLLILLLAFGVPLHAQERERLVRKEERLATRIALLETRLATSDSLRFAGQQSTVVSVGAFHVSYPTWAAEEGRRVLPRLVAERQGRYGVAIDSLLRDTLYIWIDDSDDGRPDGYAELEWRMGELRGSGSVADEGPMRLEWVNWVPSAALERWGQSLLDPELVRWLGPANPRPGQGEQRDGAVRDLILSRSSRGPRCTDGAIDECALLLELRPVADPLLESYDTLDYRGLVDRGVGDRVRGKIRCVDGGELATCVQVLQQPGHRPIPAVGGGVRQSLFDHALGRGGDEGWLRISRSRGGSPADQLALVSGLPIDSLLGEWQGELRAGHRTTAAGLGAGLLMVVLWSVVGSLFFAWRYRWRHV